MRLDRLAAFVATVDEDGTSALADRAAAHWDMPPGSARYVRTSAHAVFSVPGGYLRLVAAADADLRHGAARHQATADLAAAGAPVATLRPSAAGRWVEQVEDPVLGLVRATVTSAVPGTGPELDELSAADVAAWGASLAAFHAAGRSVPLGALPRWTDEVRASVPADGSELATAVDAWVAECLRRLGPPDTCLHGDPQPDNIGWAASRPTFFDLDDLAVGWPVVDLAFAVRDAAPLPVLEPPVLTSAAGAALLAAYGGPDAEQLAVAGLVQRLSAAATSGRLRAALAGPSAVSDPPWLLGLRARLAKTAADLHAALLAS